VTVWDFDRLIGRPEEQYRLLTGGRGRIRASSRVMNKTPGRARLRRVLRDRGLGEAARQIAAGDGSYRPFGPHHALALAGQYGADLDWLRARGRARELRFDEGRAEAPARTHGGLDERKHG